MPTLQVAFADTVPVTSQVVVDELIEYAPGLASVMLRITIVLPVALTKG